MAELRHLVVQGCGSFHIAVVKLAVLVAPTLNVEFSTEGDVVPFRDLVAVRMEDTVKVFRCLYLPF